MECICNNIHHIKPGGELLSLPAASLDLEYF